MASELLAFLNNEHDGAVLRLRRGWGEGDSLQELESALALSSKWVAQIDETCADAWESSQPLDELPRLITMDVERTFCKAENRVELCDLLSRFHRRFNDYSQTTSFVGAVLSMLLPKDKAFNLLCSVATKPNLLKDYWFDRKRFGTEAFTFNELLKTKMPEVHAHLAQHHILPEAYTQRWFLALGINVLPYKYLIRLMDAFFTQGNRVLLSFGLAFCFHRRDELLAVSDTSKLFAILRNEPVASDEIIEKIIDSTVNDQFELGSEEELDALRERVFLENIERLQPAKTAEDDEDLSDMSSDEEGVECMVCEENMPDVYCEACAQLYCESCAKKATKHTAEHKGVNLEGYDWDKLLALSAKLNEGK